MLALNNTVEKVVSQLRELHFTSKLLIAAMMLILVMGLAFVAMYAGGSDMVSLGVGHNLPTEAKAKAVSYLNAREIPWEERGGDLFVPVERKYPILAQLTEQQLITTDQIDFDSILQDDSPFVDRSTRKARYLVAKMNVVARMISELDGIDRATVVIDQPDRSGGLGAARIEPSASVRVLPEGPRLTQTRADAIARLVAGAHAALKVRNVNIVDARLGRSMRPRTDEDLAGSQHLDQKREQEKHIKEKIDAFLSYIPGVRVAVNVQVESSEVVTDQVGVEEPKVGVERERSRERTATNRMAMAEPGVRPNTGLDLSARGRESSLSDIENETRMQPVFPTVKSRTHQNRGYALKINATVLVPRSYIVSLYLEEQGGDEEAPPDAATLDALAEREAEKIRAQIEPLIETDAAKGAVAGTVVVSMFADASAAGPGAVGDETAGGDVAGGLVSESLIKTVGLAGLALLSVLLMLMMVRKASRQDEMPTAEELVGIPPALTQGDCEVVGEAGETTAALEGIEIDEEDVRRQQMLDQINELATTAPDEAANLLRKWVRSD